MKKLLIIFSFLFGALHAQDRLLDSLKVELKNAKQDTTRCVILNQLIEKHINYIEKQIYVNELVLLFESKLKKNINTNAYNFCAKFYANALCNRGFYNHKKGDNNNALLDYNNSLKIQEEINDKIGNAYTLDKLGELYMSQGDLLKAQEKYNQSLKISESTNNKQGVALALNSLALVYEGQGDISKAIEFVNNSLKISEATNNKEGIANAFSNMAYIYNKQKQNDKALNYYTQGLKIREEIGDKAGVANSLNNVGYMYDMNGDYVLALEYYKKSLKLREELNDKNGIALMLNNIGSIYQVQNDLPTTLDYYNKSLSIYKETGNKQGIALELYNIGCINLLLKKYLIAEDYLKQCKAIGQETGLIDFTMDASRILSKVYKTTNKPVLALENFELYIKMRDSLNNIDTRTSVIKQQTQYEYDKKKFFSDKEYEFQIKQEQTKAIADKTKKNIIIGSISLILILLIVFSFFLYNRFKITQKQKQIIELKEKETQFQKSIIEEKHREINESVEYAERIQQGYFTTIEFLNEHLKTGFILFKPKDKVSGDFYWSEIMNNGNVAVCVADSTGHGVPGAFMSLLNISLLNEAVYSRKDTNTADVLNFVRKILLMGMRKNIKGEGGNDGMDCVFFSINYNTLELQFSGANNNLWIIRGAFDSDQPQELIELKGDKMPVGRSLKADLPFTSQIFQLQKGDWIYASTDGFADQFGGDKGKKFMSKNLKETILNISHLNEEEQKEKLSAIFENWKEKYEQIDDVTVMGIKI